MIKFFKEIYRSQYFRNLFLLSSGVGFSQLIPLLLLPILTRFFSPEDFGLFALFMAIIQLLAISTTLRLEMAVVLPKKNTDAALLCLMSLIALISFSIFFFFFLFILHKSGVLIALFSFSDFYWLVYLIPAGMFLLGFYNILYSWNNRLELYKNMSYSHIAHSIFSTPSSILFYFLNLKPIGLILGQIIGRVIACVFLLTDLLNTLKLINRNDILKSIFCLLKTYKKFILFETPHAVLNFFSQKYIILVFSTLFGLFTVGVFDLADKIIGKPLGVISTSFKTVFYKRLTTAKDQLTLFKKSMVLTSVISLLLIIPFYIIPDNIFILFLGPEWIDVGKYIQLICPLFFSRFVFNVVTPTISYTFKNHYLLIWQIIYVFLLILLLAIIKNMNVEEVLFIYSMFGAFMYTCLGYIAFIVLKKYIKK